MLLIYLMVFMTILAIAAPYVLRLTTKYKNEITTKELVVSNIISLSICAITSALIYFSAVSSSVELLHGTLTNKVRQEVSCSHSYKCNCRMEYKTKYRTVNGKSQSYQERQEVCQTCYYHPYDVAWWLDSTLGRYSLFSPGQGLQVPERWSAAKVGESVTKENSYTDYLKGDDYSAFKKYNVKAIPEYIKALPRYPEVYDLYRSNLVVLSNGSGITFNDGQLRKLNDRLRLELQKLGRPHQVSIIVVLTDKDLKFAQYLENEWAGGRKNNAVIVFGLQPDRTINYVHTFSWSKNFDFDPSLRIDLSSIKNIDNENLIVETISKNVTKHWKRRSMEEFKYLMLQREVSIGIIISVVLLQLLLNAAVMFVIVRN